MPPHHTDLRTRVVNLVREVQALPYIWPAPPDAQSARETRCGSCASKHALLAEELVALDVESLPLFVVGPLVPTALAGDPDIAPGANLPEVHECLTVLTPWAGPLRVDVTWDPLLVRHGLPGTLDWNGQADMALAVGEGGPCWSVPREGPRAAKEALRARLYRKGEREIRDRVLQTMALLFAQWRAGGR
jgi:hypothetical protein